MIPSACPLCHPELFDGALDRVPMVIFCPRHANYSVSRLLPSAEPNEPHEANTPVPVGIPSLAPAGKSPPA